VATASTLHASATMPNFIITEYFLPFVEFGNRICLNPPQPKNGYIELSTAPGLGIEMDEKALQEIPAQVYKMRKLPQVSDEGP